MDILYTLIPLSVVLVFAILAALAWAVHAGQFEDLDTEAERILLDDDRPSAAPSAEAPAPTTAMPKAAPQPAAPPAVQDRFSTRPFRPPPSASPPSSPSPGRPALHCRTDNTSFTSFHIVPSNDFQPSSGFTRALRPRADLT